MFFNPEVTQVLVASRAAMFSIVQFAIWPALVGTNFRVAFRARIPGSTYSSNGNADRGHKAWRWGEFFFSNPLQSAIDNLNERLRILFSQNVDFCWILVGQMLFGWDHLGIPK